MPPVVDTIRPPQEAVEGPIQFSLRSLLILQTICAVFFALLAKTGIFAVLAAFVATVVLMMVRVRPQHLRLKRLGVDLMGGLILPVLCLVFDPGLICQYKLVILAYPAIGLQMLVLVLWLLLGPVRPWFSALMAGLLMVGVLIAGGIGLAMLPLSLVGLLAMGIGLLGLTPFLTAYVFGRNAGKALRHTADFKLGKCVLVVGIVIAIAVPVTLYVTCGQALTGLVHDSFVFMPFP
jgi:hypothetical protein